MASESRRIALYGVFAALIVVVFYLETLIGSFWITPPAIVSLSLLFTFCLSADWRLGLHFVRLNVLGFSRNVRESCVYFPLDIGFAQSICGDRRIWRFPLDKAVGKG